MISVVSCGVNKSDIPESSIGMIKNAAILVGGRRLLNYFETSKAEKIVLDSKFLSSLDVFLNDNIKKNVVFLASGDALFYGIGKQLSERLASENLTVIPNITAMQLLFARLNIPWQNAKCFSVHGKEKLLPFHSILSSELSVVYCDNYMTASGVAGRLIELYPQSGTRKAVIGMNLGSKEEMIIIDSLVNLAETECSGLSILLILPQSEQIVNDPGMPIGVSDMEYEKESNCITHSEVRAIVISKLKPGAGVIWDLGAGSGSVGIETALLSPCSTVYSVEKNINRFRLIEKNKIKFGCSNLKIIHQSILDALPELPSPRSVFIGGGGSSIKEILEKAYGRLIPGGRIVVTSVLLETVSSLMNTLKNCCSEVMSISVNRSVPLGNKKLMKSDNTINIFVYEKKYEK